MFQGLAGNCLRVLIHFGNGAGTAMRPCLRVGMHVGRYDTAHVVTHAVIHVVIQDIHESKATVEAAKNGGMTCGIVWKTEGQCPTKNVETGGHFTQQC